MNKKELIDVISKKTDLSKSVVTQVLDGFIEGVTDSLKDSEQVVLVGFGTFLAKDRAARQGRNPRTGETIDIPAARVPSFKAGKALKDSINQ